MDRPRYGVRDEIKDTAESFYRAVSHRSLRQIDDVWGHVPYATVAGRSGRIRQGWERVREYWEERFARQSDDKVSVRLTNTVCHAVGDVAWLSGTEIRTITRGDTVFREELRATTVLERKGSGWQIVSYHVSLPQTDDVMLASAS